MTVPVEASINKTLGAEIDNSASAVSAALIAESGERSREKQSKRERKGFKETPPVALYIIHFREVACLLYLNFKRKQSKILRLNGKERCLGEEKWN